MSKHTHSSNHTSPLVAISAAAFLVFALAGGLAVMTSTKVHIDGPIHQVAIGALIILAGIVVAIGAISTDRNS